MSDDPIHKILLAEPDLSFANAVADQLRAKNFAVVAVNDGFLASRLSENETFAGYILAVKLTGMSGLQVASTLKRCQPNLKSPVLLVAESPDLETAKRAASLGIVKMLVKPIAADQIVDTMLEALAAVKPAAAVAYDVRIMNAFINAIRETLVFYLDQKLKIGKASIKTNDQAMGYTSALIRFTGDGAKGSIGISFQRPFLLRLAGKVFPDNAVAMNDDMLADMAGEMANQVCGAVKTRFGKLGLKVMIGLPNVVVGDKHRLIHLVKNPVIVVPVSYENEHCSIEFCMDKSSEPIPEEPSEAEAATAKGGDVLLF